ncbi:hypothetical protein OsJ_12347 [Oryza sativa Japonica Group]|uniref:Uncharacterized protein n=1 Tax=Oryza sativa subsp. japonica TaxID=39947 RepID=B9FB74_ORYSJ|nr:hypothetical protein OsJ_12347 [Oryza sativa Japonica Group]
MGILECESEKDVYQQKDQVDVMNNSVNIDVDCGNDYLTRNDINGTTIDLAAVSQRGNNGKRKKNVKLKVDYNEHFQPVGPYASKLANVIGNLAKGKFLSLAYEDWTDVPNKDDVWDNVKIQPRIVEALQLNQKRPAMKVQPRIARELQLNLNKHARKVAI